MTAHQPSPPPSPPPEVVQDLTSRWASARRAALLRGTGVAQPADAPVDERALIQAAAASGEALDAVCKLVFDYSYALGRGFCRYYEST